jgi:hypothetical protein
MSGAIKSMGQDVMMQLGTFQFGINTAAYNDFKRTTEQRWACQELLGQLDALQFLGPGADAVTLSGVIYPDWRGGSSQVQDLRNLAAQGFPLLLVDGMGAVWGMWAIEGVEESARLFGAGGQARRQEFTVKLRKAADIVPGVGGDYPVDEPEAAASEGGAEDGAFQSPEDAAGEIQRLLNRSAAAATAATGELGGVAGLVDAAKAGIGAAASSVAGCVARCNEATGELQGSVARATGLLGSGSTFASVTASARAIVSDATALARFPASASQCLRNTLSSLRQAGGSPMSAISAVQGAVSSADRVSGMLRNATRSASSILSRIPGNG